MPYLLVLIPKPRINRYQLLNSFVWPDPGWIPRHQNTDGISVVWPVGNLAFDAAILMLVGVAVSKIEAVSANFSTMENSCNIINVMFHRLSETK